MVAKPVEVSFEHAAAIPVAGLIAIQGSRTNGALQPGEHVLVNGAAGRVGNFAVQIAKVLGAEVTAVCSSRNIDLVRSLGADTVIDYTTTDVVDGGARFDVMLDNVGNRTPADRLQSTVKPAKPSAATSLHRATYWGQPSTGMNTRGLPGTLAPRYQELHVG